ncbi:precorrin-2 dehydrogenase [compost metagenome]
MSIQDSLGNINFALNTKGGNPKASLMIKEEIKNNLKEYDEFIGFINKLRSKAKEFNEYKQEIISFIATEDYKFMWEKRKEKECLLLFFKEELVHRLFN